MKGKILIVVMVFLFITTNIWAVEADTSRNTVLNVFPILMFDSDIGFGFGGKGMVTNVFHRNESLDLILFGSTKGEQWIAFTFSIPDFELRQGTVYPLALDIKLEYDKYLKSNFFGIGNDSEDNEFQFPNEFTKLDIALCRAFSRTFIGELHYRFTHYSAYDFDTAWNTITPMTPGAGETDVSVLSPRIRFDTRNSFINPTRGIKADLQGEVSLKGFLTDWDFWKVRLEFSTYQSLFNERHVLAYRFWTQHLNGSAPYQELSKIGNSWTGRGYKMDRFLDNAMALTSLEYRFRFFKRLGGVLFTDIGRVWSSIEKFSLKDWHSDVGWGMRVYLTNFVVRFDMGFSNEGTRIFFQFGQVF